MNPLFNLSNYNYKIIKYCSTFKNIADSVNILFFIQLILFSVTILGIFEFLFDEINLFIIVTAIIILSGYTMVIKNIIHYFQINLIQINLIIIVIFYIFLSLLASLSLFQFFFDTEINFKILEHTQTLNHSFWDKINYKLEAIKTLFIDKELSVFYSISLVMLFLFLFIVNCTPCLIIYTQRNSIYYKLISHYEEYKTKI